MDFLQNFWSLIWWFISAFVFIAYLMALFSIISDVFRDRALKGWAKALWILFLIFVPFLTALVYLIARGGGMAERSAKQVQEAQTAADDYIRSVATVSPADEIAKAKALLDAGTISATEYESIKAKILA